MPASKELSNNNFPILLALLSVFCVAYMDVGQGREQERKLCSKSYIKLLCAPCAFSCYSYGVH